MTAFVLTQAFVRQSIRFDMGWDDWIGYAAGMAIAGSPALMLTFIRAKYGVGPKPGEKV